MYDAQKSNKRKKIKGHQNINELQMTPWQHWCGGGAHRDITNISVDQYVSAYELKKWIVFCFSLFASINFQIMN